MPHGIIVLVVVRHAISRALDAKEVGDFGFPVVDLISIVPSVHRLLNNVTIHLLKRLHQIRVVFNIAQWNFG